MVRQWEEIDMKRQAEERLGEDNQQVDEEEIEELREMLRQSEEEKEEVVIQLKEVEN